MAFKIQNNKCLDYRPSITPRQHVPSKQIISIGESDILIGIVIIENQPVRRARKYTPDLFSHFIEKLKVNSLSTRAVNIVMTLEQDRSTTISGCNTILVDEPAGGRFRSCYHNHVFITRSGKCPNSLTWPIEKGLTYV